MVEIHLVDQSVEYAKEFGMDSERIMIIIEKQENITFIPISSVIKIVDSDLELQ